jgi:crotonobetainyl-CoA:carnitine CoA-transferase CaiB-like acyl-CoA transferase
MFGALFATYSILSGLIGAARHGEGRVADVSLVEASVAAAAWEAAEYLTTGGIPQPLGNKHRLNAPYQLFETKDGRYVAIGTSNDAAFARLMQVLGLDAHIADPRFASYASRKQYEDPLVALIEPAVKKFGCADIEAALDKAGIPCSRVNNYKEVLEHPQSVARNLVLDVEHPRLGKMRAVRNPVLFDHDGPEFARTAPMLGEHSLELLGELGYSRAEIETFVAQGVTQGPVGSRGQVAAE